MMSAWECGASRAHSVMGSPGCWDQVMLPDPGPLGVTRWRFCLSADRSSSLSSSFSGNVFVFWFFKGAALQNEVTPPPQRIAFPSSQQAGITASGVVVSVEPVGGGNRKEACKTSGHNPKKRKKRKKEVGFKAINEVEALNRRCRALSHAAPIPPPRSVILPALTENTL